ncbi:XapX domain-containing protein [Bacillus sp. J33]|uniref:XapX domain-containing protein n=1 Tax=Bacillus sp. J33 TaxID=935836 RepID=UPI00047ED721|nr:XapX domain-containing protein [Bacillus sp. J33]
MKIVLLSILTGFLVGFVFAFMKLPIPAPPALPGIMGIVGIYLGFKAYEVILPWLRNIVG